METKMYGLTEIKAVKDEDRVVEFVATQEIVDYDGDVVKVEGMDISPLKATKSFLWSHRHAEPPVGKILSIKKEDGRVVGKAQMTSEEEYPFGFQIYKLIKGGYINNVSVSFLPNYAKIEYKEKDGKQIRVINESKLLEVSAVNIGANSRAVLSAKSFKDSLEKAWNDGVLDGAELKTLQDKIDALEPTDVDKKDLDINALKAKIAELELQLVDKELEENEEDRTIYDEIFDAFEYKKEDAKKDDLDELLEDVL